MLVVNWSRDTKSLDKSTTAKAQGSSCWIRSTVICFQFMVKKKNPLKLAKFKLFVVLLTTNYYYLITFFAESL